MLVQKLYRSVEISRITTTALLQLAVYLTERERGADIYSKTAYCLHLHIQVVLGKLNYNYCYFSN